MKSPLSLQLVATPNFPMAISVTTLHPSPFISAAASQPRKTPTAAVKCYLKPTKPYPPTATPTTIATPLIEPTSVPLKKVLIPIGYGTEAMEAVIMVDVLRRAGADVTLASVEPQLEVEASGGTRLVADASISTCSAETFDLIALPGGMPGSVRLRDCKLLQKMTSKQAEEKRLYGAICAAPAVTLLPWGLLKRKLSTCHPAFMDKLPNFWAVKSNLQVSGELTTSRGPGTCFQFSVSLVAQLFGESAAKAIGETLLMNAADGIPRKEEINEVEWAFNHAPRVLIEQLPVFRPKKSYYRVLIPIGNGSEEIEVVTIVDILRRAKVDVVVASVERSKQTLASRGTKIIADKSITAAADSIYDCIILTGSITGAERLHKSRVLKKLLKEQASAGRIYGALNSSPTVLERLGLLKDKRVAAHPSRVVIDGRLITGSGFSTAIDFSLAIVAKFFGHARARSVAEGLVFEYPRR